MAQIFQRWVNWLPLLLLLGGAGGGVFAGGFVYYYFSPEYTDVGYKPIQPVAFSHKLHAGDLGMDCRYCHTGVEASPHANVPATQTCMNCHAYIKPDSPKLLPVRESWARGEPVQWVNIHKVPDYAHFSHAAHVNAGVGCVSCHGRIDQMIVVEQVEPLSMGWCLECHREPVPHLRPADKVTQMDWVAEDQQALGSRLMRENNIHPPENCSACHY